MPRKNLLAILGLLLAGTACTITARLTPVQGPLSILKPPPVVVARLKANGPGQPRTLLVELPGGELCRSAFPGGAGEDGGPIRAVAAPGDAAQRDWDAVYGLGYYVARVVGSEHTRMVAVGDQGTRLTLDYFAYGQFNTGVATDSHGNVYKAVFQP